MKRPISNLSTRILDAIERTGVTRLGPFDPSLIEFGTVGNLVVIRYAGAFAGVALHMDDEHAVSRIVDLTEWFASIVADRVVTSQRSASCAPSRRDISSDRRVRRSRGAR